MCFLNVYLSLVMLRLFSDQVYLWIEKTSHFSARDLKRGQENLSLVLGHRLVKVRFYRWYNICFFKYVKQRNFNLYKFQHCEGLQLCWRQLVAEGWQVTRLSLLDMDGEILRRDFHCFDRDGEILMAVERKTFLPANVSWWSFPFCSCCLLMKLTLFWHSTLCLTFHFL